MIRGLKQKAWSLACRLSPRRANKFNALTISLAEEERCLKHRRETEEEYLRREDEAWQKELDRRHEEEERKAQNRANLMKLVVNGYGFSKPETSSRTELFLIEDGIVKRSMFIQRKA